MKFKKLCMVLGISMVLASCSSQPEEQPTTESAETNNESTESTTTENETTTGGDYESITTDEVLASTDTIIIDARSPYAYSGWSTEEYKLGGHIEGATDFSYEIFTSPYDESASLEGLTRDELIERYMAEKGINESSSLIIYDENGSDAKIVADELAARGVKDISLYDLKNWSNDLVQYDNYNLYVPPVVVKDLMAGKEVDEISNDGELVVLEVSWGTIEESGFLNGHIPNAIHVNSDDFDDEKNVYMLESDEVLFDLAKSQGITTDSTVIVTGDAIFSCRYALILEYLGVDDVYVMGGGASGWADAGYELDTTLTEVVASSDFGTTTPLNPDLIDTVDEVEVLKENSDFTLIDTRTIEEYNGETSGYGYFETAGRIDGAVSVVPGIKNSSSMMYYRNLNNVMRNGYEIIDMIETAGVDTNNHLSFYCGGGYRAAESVWDLMVMGYDNVSLFADGWIGWALAGNEYVAN